MCPVVVAGGGGLIGRCPRPLAERVERVKDCGRVGAAGGGWLTGRGLRSPGSRDRVGVAGGCCSPAAALTPHSCVKPVSELRSRRRGGRRLAHRPLLHKALEVFEPASESRSRRRGGWRLF